MDQQHHEWQRLLTSESPEDQVTALRQISSSQRTTGLTVVAAQLAGSRHDEVRMWAAEALETAIDPLPEEVDSLTELLRRADDGETAYWAATMLGRLGMAAASAADALESCLVDSLYLPAREQATWALCQIGPHAAAAADSLRKVAASGPPRLSRMASAALRAVDHAA